MKKSLLYKKLEKLVNPISQEEFIYDLLLAYGTPKANITRLKKGVMNKSKVDRQVLLAKKVFFQFVDSDLSLSTLEDLRDDPLAKRHSPRFLVVTDGQSLLANDTKIDDTLDIEADDLPKYMEFFMPLAGRERYSEVPENPADVKAAERMARLYDEILKSNPHAEKDATERHKLNVFLSRLLFCFFAEDTGIFPDRIFSRNITELTKEDGSDLDSFLNQLFEILNTQKRDGCMEQLCKFPYVNGGLFGDSYDAPRMTQRARRMVLGCGALDWSEINPDIFGSMIQAVATPETRSKVGMHYTSVPNIMKVIEPLFLNELSEEFEKAKGNKKLLERLHRRLCRMRFFDPACGSGNFLIITYKEIRKLEMKIFEQRQRIDGYIPLRSMIMLDHFYGIELDDFAHEVAILSLWLTEHQMNVHFKNKFGEARPTLPLRESGNIVCGNACALSWEQVCPNDGETIIMGNPPYHGFSVQSSEQKKEILDVFTGEDEPKKVDYISCWFLKASRFVKNKNAQFAFVSTNSICQGEQVAKLWPIFLGSCLEIGFAHLSFKWSNSAKGGAGVTCCVVGVRNIKNRKKIIYSNGKAVTVSNISPYLFDGPTVYVGKSSKSSSGLPDICYGSMARDGGNLFFTSDEKKQLVGQYPAALKFLKRVYGSYEFIHNVERWCLWIEDQDVELARQIPEIDNRLELVADFRSESKARSTRDYSIYPNRFRQRAYKCAESMIIPRISSERREYIPIGFLGENCVITDLAFAIYNPEGYLFGLLSSRMHMAWVRAVAGRLKTDYRYSSVLCYNTFPVPELTSKQKKELEELSVSIGDVREEYIGKTMADLYDPDTMPEDLRDAHHQLDLAVDRCYRKKPFESDSERLEILFKMYEKLSS